MIQSTWALAGNGNNTPSKNKYWVSVETKPKAITVFSIANNLLKKLYHPTVARDKLYPRHRERLKHFNRILFLGGGFRINVHLAVIS